MAHGGSIEVMRSQILDIFKKVELTEIANGLLVGAERAASRMTKKVFVLYIYLFTKYFLRVCFGQTLMLSMQQ